MKIHRKEFTRNWKYEEIEWMNGWTCTYVCFLPKPQPLPLSCSPMPTRLLPLHSNFFLANYYMHCMSTPCHLVFFCFFMPIAFLLIELPLSFCLPHTKLSAYAQRQNIRNYWKKDATIHVNAVLLEITIVMTIQIHYACQTNCIFLISLRAVFGRLSRQWWKSLAFLKWISWWDDKLNGQILDFLCHLEQLEVLGSIKVARTKCFRNVYWR